MIIKIQLSTMTAANVNSFPLEAAYFGDYRGHTTGYALAIDTDGYIYLSGTSTATGLGAIGNEKVWVYAKTHWRLTYEARF